MISVSLLLNSKCIMSASQSKKRGTWQDHSMRLALEAVRNKFLFLRQAAKTYDVPKSTLERRVNRKNKVATESTKHLGRYRATFSPSEEKRMVDYILDMEERFFGITLNDLQKLEYDFAEKNKIPHQFNRSLGMAGKKWLYAFLKCNPSISLRAPEPISLARAMGFNKHAVSKFFKLFEKIVNTQHFDGSRIYNCDETGVQTVQRSCFKVLSRKGKHQVGELTSAKRGKTITVVCTINAVGNFVPPFFIFPRKIMKPDLMDHGPAGSVGFCQKSGWMDGEMFGNYLKHFKNHVSASKDNSVLLVLDGHSSHTSNLQALEYTTQNGISLISLPPHTTHRMQPLDVGFLKPLRTY